MIQKYSSIKVITNLLISAPEIELLISSLRIKGLMEVFYNILLLKWSWEAIIKKKKNNSKVKKNQEPSSTMEAQQFNLALSPAFMDTDTGHS